MPKRLSTIAAVLLVSVTVGWTASSCGGGSGGPSLSKAGERGKVVFLQKSKPGCGTCHILRDAGSTAIVGPNLDLMKPDRERIIRSVTHGLGVMPNQKEVLSAGEIDDVATYVSEAAGR